MTGHVPLDLDAVRFRADIETMRNIATEIFNHQRTGISILPLLCDMEEETRHATGIDPSPALWPADLAAHAIQAWTTQR